MTSRQYARARLRSAITIVGAWTIFGAFASAHFFLNAPAGRGSFTDVATHIVTFYWAWAIMTPAILGLARRASELSGYHRALLVGALLIAAVPVHATLYLTSLSVLGIRPELQIDAATLADYLRRHTGGDLATCSVLIAFSFYRETTRRAKAREMAAAALEQRLAQAEVEILRWQLQPHFLFNALNTVSTLVLKSDSAGAERAVNLIAKYLRTALNRGAEELVTLEEELRFVRSYADIEALRFGDALHIEECISPNALGQRIPAMILQPLVENAIRHGAGNGSARRIAIAAHVADGRIVASVSNAAGNATAGPEGQSGFGLSYVRQRLAHWFGTSARLELRTRAGETVVTLDLPVMT